MVIDVVLEGQPLVSAVGVFTGGVALGEHILGVVLEHFEGGVVEVENGLGGNVWHWVLVVSHSVVGVLGHDEVSTGGVEDSGLAKVDHGACDAFLEQGHTVEQCERSTE